MRGLDRESALRRPRQARRSDQKQTLGKEGVQPFEIRIARKLEDERERMGMRLLGPPSTVTRCPVDLDLEVFGPTSRGLHFDLELLIGLVEFRARPLVQLAGASNTGVMVTPFVDSSSSLGLRGATCIGTSADPDSGKADAPLRSSTIERTREGAPSAPSRHLSASTPGGTARTGDGATWSKRFVTLPRSRPEMGPCPRVPTTITSAPASFAASAIA